MQIGSGLLMTVSSQKVASPFGATLYMIWHLLVMAGLQHFVQ